MWNASYRASFTDATRPAIGRERVSTLSHLHPVMLPEDVRASVEVASPIARAVAFGIDLSIQIGLLIAGLMVLSYVGIVSPMFALGLMFVWIFVVLIGYFFIFEGIWAGRTPGKTAMKLRVIREDGEEIGPREGIIRAFMRILVVGPAPLVLIFLPFAPEEIMMAAPFVLLSMLPFVDPKGRAPGDFVAGTLVVAQRMPIHDAERPFVPAYFELPTHYFPISATEMQRLTPDDYVRLEEYGARLATITSHARQQASMAAASALATRMKYSKPVEPQWAEVFLFEMHSALKEQLRQLYPDLYT